MKRSLRTAYGEALVAAGRKNSDIVVLEADLGRSTMSSLFGETFPHRYFDIGIAEQNMLSTAAGLAIAGKVPFCNTFAVFAAGRAYDQIRQTIAIARLNVKICGSSAGLSDYGDGATHQAIDDLALMCAIPNMTVLTPGDAPETAQAVQLAVETQGPVYIRVTRSDLPDLPSGSSGGCNGSLRVLREQDVQPDVLLLAHGAMVHAALEGAQRLWSLGISSRVVGVPVLKPLDEAGIVKLALGCRIVIAAEDHSVHGGLSAAVAFALRQSNIAMDYVAVNDEFGQSASDAFTLMEEYGLVSGKIVSKALQMLRRFAQ